MNASKLNKIFYRILGPISSLLLLLFGLGSLLIHSYYQAGFCFVLCVVTGIQYLNAYSAPKGFSAGRECVYILFLAFFGYNHISKYERDVNQDKFGLVFNEKRIGIGAPIIPKGFKIGSRGSRSVNWIGDTSAVGHQSKYIGIDSLDKIEFEEDEYKLKPLEGVKRYIWIQTRYARGRGKDSIFYTYEVADSNRTISPEIADSLFKADNIKKD